MNSITDCLVMRVIHEENIFYIYFDDNDESYVIRAKINDILCSYNIEDVNHVVNFLKLFYEDAVKIQIDILNYLQLPYLSKDIYFEDLHNPVVNKYDGYWLKTAEIRDRLQEYHGENMSIADTLFQYIRLCENTYNVYLDKIS